MTQPDDVASERVVTSLVRAFGGPGGPGTVCPDENLLVGFAEARLTAAERPGVEAHLARCEACRVLVAELGAADAPTAAPAAAPGRRWRWVLATAATLLVGLVVVIARALTHRDVEPTEARLVAAAHELATEVPDLLGGFAPLTRDERLAPGHGIERGGLTQLHPSGKVLTTRPVFRFAAEPGVAEFGIVLRTADGTLLWRTATTSNEVAFPAEQPDLQPGRRYLWQLRASGASSAATPAGRTFEVLDAPSRDKATAALRAIDDRCAPDVAALVRAHFALRSGLLADAEAAARQAVAMAPHDDVARETMLAVLTALGSDEAERFRRH